MPSSVAVGMSMLSTPMPYLEATMHFSADLQDVSGDLGEAEHDDVGVGG